MRKRPLVFVAVMFFIGILLAVYNLSAPLIFILIIAVAAAFSLKSRAAIICTVAVLIVLSGSARMNLAQIHKNRIANEYTGKTSVMELTVTEFSENNRVIALMNDAKRKTRVYLTVESDTTLFPGDIVEGEITLRAPSESKAQLNSFAGYLASRGVYLCASAESVRVTGRLEKGITGRIYSLRTYMDKVGARFFFGNRRALFNAMIFGDKRLVSDELSHALQGSGLNHIAVVSGMHLSVMIALEMFFMQKIFGRRRIGYIFAILGAFFIALVTGAGASVVRALIMCMLFQLSRFLYRENDIITSLFFAFLAMLAVNPYIIFHQGFILSVLSVLGIVLYNGKILSFLERFLPAYVAQAASISISVQLTLTPMLVYYFGIITTYTLFSNLLAVALSGVYVTCGMIFVILSPIGIFTRLFAPLINLMAAGIESVVFKVSSLPYSQIEFSGNFALFSAVWISVLVLIYIYPAPPRRLYRAATCFCIMSSMMLGFNNSPRADILFIPYGEETLTAVEISGEGAFLVDCPDIYDARSLENPILPFDCAVMTGAATGDELISIDKVIFPQALFDRESKSELYQKAKGSNTDVVFEEDLRKFQIGGAVVEYIKTGETSTARAVKIEYGGQTLITLQGLDTSDIERLFSEGICFSCDYLKLPFTIASERYDLSRLCTGKIITGERITLGK